MNRRFYIIISLLLALFLCGCAADTTLESAAATPAETAAATIAPIPSPTSMPISIEGQTMQDQPLAQQDGEWIYYCTPFDDLNAICRTNDWFETQTLITKAASPRLVTISNGWIYYFALNNDNCDSLYRIQTDGNGQECLRDNIDETLIDNFIYHDGWIYYNPAFLVSSETTADGNVTSASSCYTSGPGLYRLSLSGEQNELISDKIPWKITLSDGYIYYSNADNNGYLYKMGLDGSNPQKVAEINLLYSWSPFTEIISIESRLCIAEDGYIYYDDHSDLNSNIYLLDLKNNSSNQIAVAFNTTVKATEDWLFYAAVEYDYSNEDNTQMVGAIYCTKKDGSETTTLFNIRNIIDYTVINDTIIFSYYECVENNMIFNMAYSDIDGNIVDIPVSGIPVPDET